MLLFEETTPNIVFTSTKLVFLFENGGDVFNPSNYSYQKVFFR